MFSGCSDLSSLGLSNFDTSNVTYMSGMFKGCSGLSSLDLRSFNTTNVMYIDEMFSGCRNLKEIIVSSAWDISNAKYTSGIYAGCGTNHLTVK